MNRGKEKSEQLPCEQLKFPALVSMRCEAGGRKVSEISKCCRNCSQGNSNFSFSIKWDDFSAPLTTVHCGM